MTDARSEPDWVTLARLVKTQGRKGELAAEVLSDIPGRFDRLRRVWLCDRTGRRQAFTLARNWAHKSWRVLAFEEIHDLDGAGPWVGALLQVPRSERAPVPAGRYFHDDLLGCAVYDGERLLGTLTAIEPVEGAPDLLHVGAVLIPFAADYVAAIDLPSRVLRLRLPPGLVGLNDAV